MSVNIATVPSTTSASDSATRKRVGLLAIVLGATAVLAIFGGMLWPEPSGGGETYSYVDIKNQRDLWWGLLMVLAALQVCNVPLQALATMLLVRERGSAWATVGGALMWVGCGMQGAGVAAWAATYFYPTDPSVPSSAGTAELCLCFSEPCSSASACSARTWCRSGCPLLRLRSC
jgi:hypothetical protein